LLCDDAGDGLDEQEAPPLHAVYAASVRQRVAMGRRAGATVLRLGDAPTAKPASPKGRRQARLGGFDLHANTSVRAKNRPKLERLCRYLLRPPVAEDRLSFGSDGSVFVRLKTPWRDGTSHIALQPLELLEKLAALIPRPYVNSVISVVGLGIEQPVQRLLDRAAHELREVSSHLGVIDLDDVIEFPGIFAHGVGSFPWF
jgi:hypothetical protein